MLSIALKVALTYWGIFVLDETFAWQTLVRPIVTGPIMGFVLGDIQTGIIMGAALEGVYMGIVNTGGAAPADAFSATVICVAFVIAGGMDMEAGLALALPIGTLMRQCGPLAQPIHGYFVKVFEGYLSRGDTKRFERLQRVYRFLFSRLVHTIVIFFSIAIGVENVEKVMTSLPGFILSGLSAAGSMLPAVGIAVLLTMTWTKELGAFFVFFYVFAAYLGLDSMAVALIGISIAVIAFFIDAENKRNKSDVISTEEEDFFA